MSVAITVSSYQWVQPFMIVVNEIHDFEEIPPQVQYFVVFGSKKASANADAFFCTRNKKNAPPGSTRESVVCR
jgi:hypothetical protein